MIFKPTPYQKPLANELAHFNAYEIAVVRYLYQCPMLHQSPLLCVLLMLHVNDAVESAVMLVVRLFDTTSVGFAPTSDTFIHYVI